jgi:acyl-CoA synthetase (AMP-forming)/AMP-acid ligase II
MAYKGSFLTHYVSLNHHQQERLAKLLPLREQMMDYPLTLTHVLDRARQLYGKKEIVTKAGPTLERYTYAEMTERVARLANALEKLGVRRGDRVLPER